MHLLVKSDVRPEKREFAMRSALNSDAPNNAILGLPGALSNLAGDPAGTGIVIEEFLKTRMTKET